LQGKGKKQMNETKPVMQKNPGANHSRASHGLGHGLRVIGASLLGLVFALSAVSSSIGQAKPVAPATPTTPAVKTQSPQVQTTGDFVGSETCEGCHTDVVKNFAGNPHMKLALEHGKSGVSCESCHGAGRAHVEGGGDVTKIFNFKTATEKEATARCLSCHAGTHPNFARSPHAKAQVGCLSCHSVHAPGNEIETKELLLKSAQPALCFGCHSDTKPQFAMPFHHKVNEGVVSCSDCHDVHGTFGNNNLKSTADQNAICTKCHTEKRGPFVYEHAAVKAEGCLSCHTPHGSQNARLLNMPSVNMLCSQCHSAVATSTIHNFTWTQSSDVTPCIDCHTMVHGSNMEPGLIR
jgi:DmsE family decaheme c-type cytochrome